MRNEHYSNLIKIILPIDGWCWNIIWNRRHMSFRLPIRSLDYKIITSVLVSSENIAPGGLLPQGKLLKRSPNEQEKKLHNHIFCLRRRISINIVVIYINSWWIPCTATRLLKLSEELQFCFVGGGKLKAIKANKRTMAEILPIKTKNWQSCKSQCKVKPLWFWKSVAGEC